MNTCHECCLTIEKLNNEYDILYEEKELYKKALFSQTKIDLAKKKLKDLDDIVTEEKEIIIKQTFTCYCHDNMNKRSKYFTVKCKENESITNKYIMNELIKKNLKLECEHRFLEGFNHSNDNIYEMWTGS